MQQVELDRFELTGLLGTGADYEVRSATDLETRKSVVLKRPVPQSIRNRMHGAVESRTDRTVEAYEAVGPLTSLLSPMVGYTERANHDVFYGDSFGQEYRVIAYERAQGFPLVGDVRARIMRVPIGLGQNLFALHPLGHQEDQPAFTVHQQLLEVEEAFQQAGYLLLDLSPQNVFYQPATDRITVIDSGALLVEGAEPVSRSQVFRDQHDFFLELLKFYTSPQLPPEDVNGYRDPHGLRPAISFEQELDEIANNFQQADGPVKTAALAVISKVRERSYSSFDDFRQDLTQYSEEVRIRNRNLPNLSLCRQAWREALELLRADHWARYLFEHETDLVSFNDFQ